jgi:hypothetical protein
MEPTIKKTAGQVLIASLTRISTDLGQITKMLDKFQDRYEGQDKASYEFRIGVINGIKDFDENLKEFETAIKDLISKMDIKDDKLIELINELKLDIREQGKIDYDRIKDIMEGVKGSFKLSDDCDNCELVKDKERWIKRLWGIVVVSAGLLLTLLGLNVMGIIKSLPGIN